MRLRLAAGAFWVAAALTLLPAACSSGGTPKPGARATAAVQAPVLQAGTEAVVGAAAITVTGARTVPPQAGLSPPAGSTWIAVAMRIRNPGTRSYTLSVGLSVTVLDSKGHKLGQPAQQVPVRALGGVIPAGQTAEGEVVYEAPARSAPYTVRFQPPFGGAGAAWSVPLK